MSKLYVGNLPSDCNESALRQLFQEHSLACTTILVKRGGYAFVDCADQSTADRAIDKLNGEFSPVQTSPARMLPVDALPACDCHHAFHRAFPHRHHRHTARSQHGRRTRQRRGVPRGTSVQPLSSSVICTLIKKKKREREKRTRFYRFATLAALLTVAFLHFCLSASSRRRALVIFPATHPRSIDRSMLLERILMNEAFSDPDLVPDPSSVHPSPIELLSHSCKRRHAFGAGSRLSNARVQRESDNRTGDRD